MKILGIDYGQKRIGLAIGISGVATPLKELPYRKKHQIGDAAIAEIVLLLKEEQIETVVIGLPIMKNNEEGLSVEIKEFADILKDLKSDIKIVFQDESKTSKEAVDRLVNKGVSKKRRKKDNSQAAAIILERYYDNLS